MQELAFETMAVTRAAAYSLPPKPRGRRSVFVLNVLPPGKRRFDRQNLRAGCKPILDALKRLGVIHGDTPRWVEDDADQRRAEPGELAPATRITVTDLPHHDRRACRG